MLAAETDRPQLLELAVRGGARANHPLVGSPWQATQPDGELPCKGAANDHTHVETTWPVESAVMFARPAFPAEAIQIYLTKPPDFA